MNETIDAIGTNLMILVGLGLMGFVAYIQHREHMAMLRRLEDRRLLSQPITTIPRGRKILVKHEKHGWFEATYSMGGVWGSLRWYPLGCLLAWAELPEEDTKK